MSVSSKQKYAVTNSVFYGGKVKAVPVHGLKAYGGVKIFLRAFLTLDSSGGNRSTSRTTFFLILGR